MQALCPGSEKQELPGFWSQIEGSNWLELVCENNTLFLVPFCCIIIICEKVSFLEGLLPQGTLRYCGVIIKIQAQRRAAMERRMHCIIPNESYNINHNTFYIFMK